MPRGLRKRKRVSPPFYDKLAHLRMAEASAAILAIADAVRADVPTAEAQGGCARL